MSISLKELKKNRLTPAEKYILDFIEGAEPEKLPHGSLSWWKDGKWLFAQDFKGGWLLMNWHGVWFDLKRKFGLNNDETKELLTNMLYDYTDNGRLKVA